MDIKEFLIKRFNVSDDNLKIDFLNIEEINSLLLLCTDKKMILGFFKDDGTFDQNRLFVSTQDNCIRWANDLFNYFNEKNF